VPDITREFRNTNPDVRLDLTYLTSPEQRDKILQDEIDLGFIEGSFHSSEIETRPIVRHKADGAPAAEPPAGTNAVKSHRRPRLAKSS
jgi:DNA-binding transcriptional LysR family regulator